MFMMVPYEPGWMPVVAKETALFILWQGKVRFFGLFLGWVWRECHICATQYACIGNDIIPASLWGSLYYEGVVAEVQHRSTHMAIPMPPPMHRVASPFFASRRCIS